MVKTSTTASWNEAATWAIGTDSPARSRASTHRATAVFSPENEKSRLPSSDFPRGNAIERRVAFDAPPDRCADRRETATRARGPPCRTPRRRRRRPSSPATALRVVTSGTSSNDECPPDTSNAMHGSRQRPVFEGVDGDMRRQMVDAVERLVEGECVGLRGRDSDEQRAGKTWARCHRDRVDVAHRNPGVR